MNQAAIVFRRAEASDVNTIRQLLHADSRLRNEVYILEHIDQIYILAEGKRVLGALYGIPGTGKAEIGWVVVHPLYPELAIAEIMIREFQGIYCRFYEPERRSEKEKTIKRLLATNPEAAG